MSGPKRNRPRQSRPRLAKYDSSAEPIWETAEELAAQVPDSEWRKVPPDLARNLHHYLHGGSKDDAE
jgi:hypothetical protein